MTLAVTNSQYTTMRPQVSISASCMLVFLWSNQGWFVVRSKGLDALP